MKKKLITFAMTVAMSLSAVIFAFADTSDTLSGSVPFSNTGDEKLEGDFDVTYTFHTASTPAQNWDTFAIEFYSDAVTAGTTGKGYLTLRADCYGWWAEGWNEAKNGTAVNDVNANWKQEGTAVWDTWKTDIASADVTINAERSGETISVEYIIECDNGAAYTFTNSIENIHGFGDYVYVHLTMAQDNGVQVDLTNIKFANNGSAGAAEENTAAEDEEETTTEADNDNETTTGADAEEDSDESMNPIVIVVIVIVAVAVIAGILVATKKKNN